MGRSQLQLLNCPKITNIVCNFALGALIRTPQEVLNCCLAICVVNIHYYSILFCAKLELCYFVVRLLARIFKIMNPADLLHLLQKIGAAAMMNEPDIPFPDVKNVLENLK